MGKHIIRPLHEPTVLHVLPLLGEFNVNLAGVGIAKHKAEREKRLEAARSAARAKALIEGGPVVEPEIEDPALIIPGVGDAPRQIARISKALAQLEQAKGLAVGKGKLAQLTLAKGNLKMAAKNKGGFRTKALQETNKAFKAINQKQMDMANQLIASAIENVKKGINHANRNNKESQPLMKKALAGGCDYFL